MKKVLTYALPLLLAAGMVYYISGQLNLSSMWQQLTQVRYEWVLLSMLVSITSHVSRAIRWKMLLTPLGYKIKSLNAFYAVMIGYLANYALPRLGEVTRCGVLMKTDEVPMVSAIGTVVVERLLDVLMLLVLMLLCLVLAYDQVYVFIHDFGASKLTFLYAFGEKTLPWLWLIALIGFATLFVMYKFRKMWMALPGMAKVFDFVQKLWGGLTSIKDVKNLPVFIFHTLNIWFFYGLMNYLIFFSVDASSSLSPVAALVVLVLGGIGMAAPVQGGIGAYHLMVAAALALYGVKYETGIVLATVMHASQMVLNVLLGLISLVMISFSKTPKHAVSEG